MNTSNRKMTTSNKQVVYKTFCKVCQDAAKTEKEYTSHNVRDAKGKTCCPTLLAQECRTCYKKGHTSKYCTQSKAVTQTPVIVVKPAPKQVTQVKTQAQKNVFMLLESDSDSDSEAVIVKRTEPVPVPLAELKIAQKQVLNYSRIIALAPALVKTEIIASALKENAAPKKAHVPTKAPFNWATCESDSSGDEEEDEDEDEEEISAW